MEKEKCSCKKEKRRLLPWILLSIFAGVTTFVVVIFSIWGNEINTMSSIRKIRARDDAISAGDVYEMRVSGGFYLDEFVAQGGVNNDKELIAFITNNITKGLMKVKIDESKIGCSSFTATTQDGDRLFARNYDLGKTNAMIVYTKGVNGRHSTVSSVDLQFIGLKPENANPNFSEKMALLAAPFTPLDGMNDAGLSVGIYMSNQGSEKTVATNQMTDRPDITSTTLLRLMLDYSSNIEEAVAIANKYDLHDSAQTSYHYMVADATGKSAVLEWVNGTDETDNDGTARKLVVTYNDNDAHIGTREAKSNYQWLTNYIIQPNYYSNTKDMEGLDRYDLLYTNLSKTNGVVKDEKDAMNILSSVGRRKGFTGAPNTVTIHSVVYNLTKKTGLWVSNEQYDKKDATFALSL